MSTTSGTRTLNITLLTVCVDPDTAEAVLYAAEQRHWAVTPASLDRYVSAKRRTHFGDHLKAGEGCVAILDFDHNALEAAETATYLEQVFGGRISVLALAAEPTPQLMLLAMRSGCTEFLRKGMDARTLEDAFRRIEQQLANRSARASASGSIIAFFGAKGGVGTSTLAVHLATFLIQNHKKKVLLIDNHAQFGHACIYLGLDGSGYHFQELVRNVNRLDSELLRGFIATHGSGLDVLSSPDVGQSVRAMHPDDVAATLEFLRTEYDFVIVDCEPGAHEINRAALAAATQIYVIATPEISAIRDLSRHVDDLLRMEMPDSKVKVVINRYSSQFAVSLEEIEKAIHLPVSFSIPNSYIELVRSANLGIPLTPEEKSGFTAELTRWSHSLVGSAPAKSAAAAATPQVSRRRPLGALRNTLNAVLHPHLTSTAKGTPASAVKRA